MLGGTVYCVATALSAWDGFFITAFIYGLFAAIFVAMRTALGENTDRTRSFSDGLPISVWQRGSIRLAGGAAVLVVPIVAGAVLLSFWTESGSGMVWCVAAVVAWSATTFYLILSLLGTALAGRNRIWDIAEPQPPACGFFVLTWGALSYRPAFPRSPLGSAPLRLSR